MPGPLPTGTCATCKTKDVKLRPNPFNQKLQCSDCRDTTIIGITDIKKRYGLKPSDVEGLSMTTEPQPAFRGGPDRKWYWIKDVEKRLKVVEKTRAKELKEKEKKAAEKLKAKQEKEEEKKRVKAEKEEKKRVKAEEKEAKAALKKKTAAKKELKRKYEDEDNEEGGPISPPKKKSAATAKKDVKSKTEEEEGQVPTSPKKPRQPSKDVQIPALPKTPTTPKKRKASDPEPGSDIDIPQPKKRSRLSKASLPSETASADKTKQKKSVDKGAVSAGPTSPIKKPSRAAKSVDSPELNEPRKSSTVDRRASVV